LSDFSSKSFRDQLSDGRRAMAHLIHVWHEMNSWSHKVLPALVECLDLGRVHNSQISNLRNGKLFSPGPEVFLALGQANLILSDGLFKVKTQLEVAHPELLKVLEGSSLAIRDNAGKPLRSGDFFEIFVGLTALPASFDWFIEEEEALGLSAALSEYLSEGKPWRQCRKKILDAYPVTKQSRRDRFAQVMAGVRDYSAEELDGELLDLHTTNCVLKGSIDNGVNQFLNELRVKASILISK